MPDFYELLGPSKDKPATMSRYKCKLGCKEEKSCANNSRMLLLRHTKVS